MEPHSDEWPVSHRVVETVAENQGVAETELTPLTRVVDTDALNVLVESADETEIDLQFEYEDSIVHIDTSKEMTVTTR